MRFVERVRERKIQTGRVWYRDHRAARVRVEKVITEGSNEKK